MSLRFFYRADGTREKVTRSEYDRRVKASQAASERAGRKAESQDSRARKYRKAHAGEIAKAREASRANASARKARKSDTPRRRDKYGRFSVSSATYQSGWYNIDTSKDASAFLKEIHERGVRVAATEISHRLDIAYEITLKGVTMSDTLTFRYTPKESQLKERTFGDWVSAAIADIATMYASDDSEDELSRSILDALAASGPGMRYKGGDGTFKPTWPTYDTLRAKFRLYPV